MYTHIGEVIRYIREDQGLTQTFVGDMTEVERKTVGRIEATGQGRIESVEKILGVLGYELEIVPKNGRKKALNWTI